MATAYLHLNGTDYELAHSIPSADDPSFHRLQTQLERVLARPDDGPVVGQRAGSPQAPVHFDVRLNDCAVDLAVAARSIHVGAVYLRDTQGR